MADLALTGASSLCHHVAPARPIRLEKMCLHMMKLMLSPAASKEAGRSRQVGLGRSLDTSVCRDRHRERPAQAIAKP